MDTAVRPDPRFQYGVLLPHFGSHAQRERILQGSRKIEEYGFDSVWVRDHIVYHPHTHEDQDRTHLDPLITLAAIGSVTRSITLATGSLIPHRHPIQLALAVSSIDFLVGPGRILLSMGIGTYNHEFAAIGIGDWDRREVIEEYVAVVRQMWTGEAASFEGKYFRYAEVDVHPTPGAFIPIWYGGMSMAAVRRAVEYCDGWIPGRMPMRDYARLLRRMDRIAADHERSRPHTGAIPLVCPARTVEEGLAFLDVPQLEVEMQRNRFLPPDGVAGGFSTLSDFDGAVIAGPPDVIVEEVLRCQEGGVEHFVFDFRQRFDAFEECLAILGEEVLPQLHRAAGGRPGVLEAASPDASPEPSGQPSDHPRQLSNDA
ncbi:MAG: LLM class flavin-dependent oxidoreductase [Candidatus Dormibacteria bacterium]